MPSPRNPWTPSYASVRSRIDRHPHGWLVIIDERSNTPATASLMHKTACLEALARNLDKQVACRRKAGSLSDALYPAASQSLACACSAVEPPSAGRHGSGLSLLARIARECILISILVLVPSAHASLPTHSALQYFTVVSTHYTRVPQPNRQRSSTLELFLLDGQLPCGLQLRHASPRRTLHLSAEVPGAVRGLFRRRKLHHIRLRWAELRPVQPALFSESHGNCSAGRSSSTLPATATPQSRAEGLGAAGVKDFGAGGRGWRVESSSEASCVSSTALSRWIARPCSSPQPASWASA
eukprot:scaffold2963_cov250-Pinguiococcus_pyrenoidosus.AAC.11